MNRPKISGYNSVTTAEQIVDSLTAYEIFIYGFLHGAVLSLVHRRAAIDLLHVRHPRRISN